MNNTIKQEVREEFERSFCYAKGHTMHEILKSGMRREEIEVFLEETIDRVREAAIHECVEALPEPEQHEKHDDHPSWCAVCGRNVGVKAARTALLALKNKNIDV